MKTITKIFALTFITFLSFFNVFAETEETQNSVVLDSEETENKQIIENILFQKNIKIWEQLTIDLSSIEATLQEKYNSEIEFEWNLQWINTKLWSVFEKVFTGFWEKSINLNIYTTNNNQKKLLINKPIDIFVYNTKFPAIIDASMWQTEVEQYITKSIELGTYVETIALLDEKEIETQNIYELIWKLDGFDGEKWNYIWIWWEKDFLFSIISKLNKDIVNTEIQPNLNLVLISPFNIDVVNNYLKNFVSNKSWIKKILLLSWDSKFQVATQSDDINKLKENLEKKWYTYVDIDTTWSISRVLFISNFVNTLSNKWFSSNNIYIILLIPFLFLWISFMKHFIWLSPIGITIPIGLTILFFQIGLLAAMIIFVVLVWLNLILSKLTNKYTLLYTPKISFLITINIVVAMLLITLLLNYDLIKASIGDVIFIIFFIIISERLITLILWKEFWEYKYNLLNTLLFAIVAYLLLNMWIIKTLVFAYPEIIIFLIPLNFMIWRFTWLRITEYFRFKDVIKSVEE